MFFIVQTYLLTDILLLFVKIENYELCIFTGEIVVAEKSPQKNENGTDRTFWNPSTLERFPRNGGSEPTPSRTRGEGCAQVPLDEPTEMFLNFHFGPCWNVCLEHTRTHRHATRYYR